MAHQMDKDDELAIAKNFLSASNVPLRQVRILSSSIQRFSENRAGFLGDHYALTLEVATNDEQNNENKQTLELFVKTLPVGMEKLLQYLTVTKVFAKEIAIYQELMPRLQQYGRFAPKCYYVKDSGMLVFENLAAEGYRVREGCLDLMHLEQALRALAKLHAASLAMESKHSKSLVEQFPTHMEENAWLLKDGYPRVQELEEDIQTLCAFIPELVADQSSHVQLQQRLSDAMREIYELVKPSNRYQNVCSQGDLWNNNLLFQYDANQKPTSCIIVDFQLARYVPPAYDFNMLVTLTTSAAFRKAHWTFLQGFYYQSLKTELWRCNLPIERFLSSDEFRDSCQHYRRAGAVDNFIVNNMVKLPRNFLDGIFSSPELHETFVGDVKCSQMVQVLRTNDAYRATMQDVVEYMRDVFCSDGITNA